MSDLELVGTTLYTPASSAKSARGSFLYVASELWGSGLTHFESFSLVLTIRGRRRICYQLIDDRGIESEDGVDIDRRSNFGDGSIRAPRSGRWLEVL